MNFWFLFFLFGWQGFLDIPWYTSAAEQINQWLASGPMENMNRLLYKAVLFMLPNYLSSMWRRGGGPV